MMRILRQRSTLFSSNCDKRSKAHAAFSFAIDVPVFRALANGLIAPDEAISPLFSSQKLEIEGKNRASAGDWQNTSKGRIYTLTNLIANSSLNSHVELSVPEDKCMVLTEESEFMRKELETEVNKHHYNPNQLIDDSYRESDIDLEHASQTDSFLGPSFKNKEESSVDASYDPARFRKLNMGNEMGNNNTSGLREEDSTTDEAREKSVQEPTDSKVVKEENHVVPTEESKDYHEKVTGLDCDNMLKFIQLLSLLKLKRNQMVGGGDDKLHPASFPNELEGDEKSTESNLEEIVLGENSNQLGRTSFLQERLRRQRFLRMFTTLAYSTTSRVKLLKTAARNLKETI
uniref:Uncharacterized protein n=1 Tax=Salix viminalis TaxID=40686 RepID=A0A6N2N2G2_SALVM